MAVRAISFYKDANSWKINGNPEPTNTYRALYSSGNTKVTVVNADQGSRSLFPRTLITEIEKNAAGDLYADFTEFDAAVGSFFFDASSDGGAVNVFGIFSENDFPTPSGGVSTLVSGLYIIKDAVTLSSITEFQCAVGAVVEWRSEDKENHTLSSPTTGTLFVLSNGSRFKIEHASFILSGNGAQFCNLSGPNFNSKINDFRVTFTGTGGTIGQVANIFSGTTEFVDGAIVGFTDGLEIDNTGGTQVLGMLLASDGTGTGAILSALNVNALAVNFNSNVIVGGASQSAYFIDPITPVITQIHDTVISGVGSFFKSGATGTFTVVTDASVGATAITSVTDSGGIARFNFTGPTIFVNQNLVLSALTNYTNGEFIVTATDGTSYFEISSIPFNGADTGSFLSNSVTLTDIGTTLIDGDKVFLDTDLSVDYDIGTFVYNQQVNSIQVNATWTVTATGTWDTGSLTEDNKIINSVGNGAQAPSENTSSMFVKGSVATTTITGGWDPLNLGTITPGSVESRFKLLNTQTGERIYTGLFPLKITGTASISAQRGGGTVTHAFRMIKTVDTQGEPFDVIEISRGIGTTIGSVSLPFSGIIHPGDQFRPEVEAASGITVITISEYADNLK